MDVTVICNEEREYAVVDALGNIIVPFGKFGWIEDFNRGYARVKSFSVNFRSVYIDGQEVLETPKWGLIDKAGNIVVPVEYDEIWKLHDGFNRIVLYKAPMPKKPMYKHSSTLFDFMKCYGGKPKEGSVYFDIRDGKIYPTPFSQDQSDRNSKYDSGYDDYDDYDDYDEHHYGEYAGTYAQDVEGYSDEEIDTIFDGEPDAYWNID